MRQAISLITATLIACAAAPSFAQPATAPAPGQQQRKFEPPPRVPADMAAFFSGDWAGKGQFASGRPIEADVSFRLELDGQWLEYRHTDRAPNSYKALGMWGFDSTTRKLVMTVNDNGGSARSFDSDGWNDGTITFSRTISSDPLREERFVFAKLSDNSWRMTYEVHAAPREWRMIDTLVFERVAK
ncbi:hypothetical protein [Massilia horti]|uniref:DUF1579 domain-containing protein n=1 Tax=Massilia horti TaxID=2562153 RepID=A0A4Y9T4Q2_9BURK|nr:hypothetical protein [Massilia horti]TFW35213.1 hypothetical protein E4O92_02340 [Massilia horti]